jgi:hypothetical protein
MTCMAASPFRAWLRRAHASTWFAGRERNSLQTYIRSTLAVMAFAPGAPCDHRRQLQRCTSSWPLPWKHCIISSVMAPASQGRSAIAVQAGHITHMLRDAHDLRLIPIRRTSRAGISPRDTECAYRHGPSAQLARNCFSRQAADGAAGTCAVHGCAYRPASGVLDAPTDQYRLRPGTALRKQCTGLSIFRSALPEPQDMVQSPGYYLHVVGC